MTKKFLITGILFIGLSFAGNAQNNVDTSLITSGGYGAGTSGTSSTYYGAGAGKNTTSAGNSNTFVGSNTGYSNITGYHNTYLGNRAGYYNKTGIENVCVGSYSGSINYTSPEATAASGNTYLGYHSGNNSKGSGNVFIGRWVGHGSSGSNLLYIDNSSTSTPLVWGDFAANELKFNGRVGISMGSTAFPTSLAGVDVNDYELFVNGGILATEIRVATTWADYVFEEDYTLLTPEEVKAYIKENGHLPNVPSAKEIEEQGIEVGEMTKIQQEKIEELTLYIIEQDEALKKEKEINEKQDKEIKELKAMVKQLLERNQ